MLTILKRTFIHRNSNHVQVQQAWALCRGLRSHQGSQCLFSACWLEVLEPKDNAGLSEYQSELQNGVLRRWSRFLPWSLPHVSPDHLAPLALSLAHPTRLELAQIEATEETDSQFYDRCSEIALLTLPLLLCRVQVLPYPRKSQRNFLLDYLYSLNSSQEHLAASLWVFFSFEPCLKSLKAPIYIIYTPHI